MNDFVKTLLSWQPFYTAIATASSALTGLLFVSLSLNRSLLDTKNIKKAKQAFRNFLNVLVISLIFLIPHVNLFTLGISLFMFGLALFVGVIGELANIRKYSGKQKSTAVFIEFSITVVPPLGVIALAIAFFYGKTSAMYWPVGIVVLFLIMACLNAWEILMKEKEE
jgi:heme/copper-type cytochrome/quinol oxidase subunit 2